MKPGRIGWTWPVGPGWLAVEWLRARLSAPIKASVSAWRRWRRPGGGGRYRRRCQDSAGEARIDFRAADFSLRDWEANLPAASFTGGLCFAVLHHLPGSANRVEFLRRAGACCARAGCSGSQSGSSSTARVLPRARYPGSALG